MEAHFFTLCEAATQAAGSLNILGTFDTFLFDEMPNVIHCKAFASLLRFTRSEAGIHVVRLAFIDADGKPSGQLHEEKITVKFNDASAAFSSLTYPFLAKINEMRFDEYGDFSVDLSIDGTHVASCPLFVRKRMGGTSRA